MNNFERGPLNINHRCVWMYWVRPDGRCTALMKDYITYKSGEPPKATFYVPHDFPGEDKLDTEHFLTVCLLPPEIRLDRLTRQQRLKIIESDCDRRN